MKKIIFSFSIFLIFILFSVINTYAQNVIDKDDIDQIKNCQDLPSYHKKNIQTFLNSLDQEEKLQIQTIQENLAANSETQDEIFLFEANPVEIIDYKIPQLSSFYKRQFDQIDQEYVKCIEIKNKLCCYNPVFKSQHTEKVVVKRKKRILNQKHSFQKYQGQCFHFQKSLKTQIGVDLFNTGVDILDKCFPKKKTVPVPTIYHKQNPLNKEWENPKFKLLIDVQDQDDNQSLSQQKVEFLGAGQFNQESDLEGKINILIDDKNIIRVSKIKELTIKADSIYKESKTTIPINFIEELVAKGSYHLTIYREKKFKQSLTITLPCIETLKKQNYSLFFSLDQGTEERQVNFNENATTAFYAFENKASELKIILKDNKPNAERILYSGPYKAVIDQNLLGISCLHVDKKIIDSKDNFLSKGQNFEFQMTKELPKTESELNLIKNKVGPQGDMDFLFFNIDKQTPESFHLKENEYDEFFPLTPSKVEMSRGEKKNIVISNKIRCDELPNQKKKMVESSKIIEMNPSPTATGFSIYSMEAKLMKYNKKRTIFELVRELPKTNLVNNKHYSYNNVEKKISITEYNPKEISPFFMISKCFNVEQEGTILFKKINAISDNEGELFLNNEKIGAIANYNGIETTIKNIAISKGQHCIHFKWYNRFKDNAVVGNKFINNDTDEIVKDELQKVFYYQPSNNRDRIDGIRGVTPYDKNKSYISFDIQLEFKSYSYKMMRMSPREIESNKNDCYNRIKKFYTPQE
ncbi:MAG: hypothetical protein QE271_10680 [Bacteriovoracaceae bacterium]|nr:hypothetical protein [Bacteriovoracaceae bacterium]